MKAIKKESEKMKEKTLLTVIQNRFSSRVLNTSYPLRPSDWFPYRVEGTLPFDDKVPLSFYVHIPFCKHLCRFCECTRMALPDATHQQQYLAVISRDIDQFIASHPDSVFRGFDIGGGTPTALTDDNFKRLMSIYADTINRVQVTDDFEPSIEGTFLTINREKLQAIVQAGFRRLSLGIQTSAAAVLDAQGRSVAPLDLMKDTLDKAHDAGIQKINLDLMYGLAGQNGASQQRDFEVIDQLAPEQVTLYELRTNMLHDVQSASKEELYAAYCSYYDTLLQMGYHARFGQNTFSRSDKDFGVSSYLRSRMLEGAPYRGFGISAQSMNSTGIAYNPGKNEHALTSYLSRSSYEEESYYALPPEELLSKYIAISAYSGGFSLDIASRILGKDASKHFHRELTFCLNEGLLTRQGDRVQISRKGFLHYGAVFSLFYLKPKNLITR